MGAQPTSINRRWHRSDLAVKVERLIERLQEIEDRLLEEDPGTLEFAPLFYFQRKMAETLLERLRERQTQEQVTLNRELAAARAAASK